MEFRLTYTGRLLGASRANTRAAHKQELRKSFHPQLRNLWSITPFLDGDLKGSGKRSESVADKFMRNGYRFVPLVTRELSLISGVDILFLRPDPPGDIIKSGDIDNRLKTLFDAFRLPGNKDELGGFNSPDEDEDPFFCLLEDDSLISHVSVETDRLLGPTGADFDVNSARLVITVRIRPFGGTWNNLVFI